MLSESESEVDTSPSDPAPLSYWLPLLVLSKYFENAAAQEDLRDNILRRYFAPMAVPVENDAHIAKHAVPYPIVFRHPVSSPYAGIYGSPLLYGFATHEHGS